MKPGRAYYTGGVRVEVEGVPIKLARKPSAHNLAWSREWEKYLNSDASSFLDAKELRKQRAKEARYAIYKYAEILEISETQAKARINRQRQHLIANPVRDLSLEYDL